VGKQKEPYRYYDKDHPYLSTLNTKKRVDYRRKQKIALATVLVFLFFLVEFVALWGASSSRVAYSPLRSSVMSGVKPPKPKLLVKAEPDKAPPPPVLVEADMYLVVPKLFINTPIESMGSSSAGEVLLPTKNTNVAWYKDGVKPGANGSVFLSGYYGNDKAGILKDASKLEVNDSIEIRYKNGKSVSYKVIEKTNYAPNEEIKPELLKKDDAKYLSLFMVSNSGATKIGLDAQRLVIYAKAE
jgi:hypothetical protein